MSPLNSTILWPIASYSFRESSVVTPFWKRVSSGFQPYNMRGAAAASAMFVPKSIRLTVTWIFVEMMVWPRSSAVRS